MFKESFKYFKSRDPAPDLSNVLDFDDIKFTSQLIKISILNELDLWKFGLNPTTIWEAYELRQHPGLIFIRNPFTSSGQRYWTVRCLRDYTKKPNRTNLDQFQLIPKDGDWWDLCQSRHNKSLLNKLRWVTLGYHHDWDTKVYKEENKNVFPQDLAELCKAITNVFGFNFNAEAAIINFYHMNSTLSGHTDHSEQNLIAPLLSFSFGQSAIFLLGGRSIEDPTTPMLVKSGDIIIMSKESRLCYHGIPKILKTESKFWNCFSENNEELDTCQEWGHFSDYLNNSRINMNVRQVLKQGEKKLCT